MKPAAVAIVVAILGAGPSEARPANPADFTGGARFTPQVSTFDMISKATGRTYRIWIAKPSAPAPPGGYGVIYLTDGNPNFPLAADQMVARQYLGLKPAVVVGVGYPVDDLWTFTRLRGRDLIPFRINAEFEPAWQGWSSFGGGTDEDAGGGEAFYRFITEELRPRVNVLAPNDASDQALYGHSLGGLFTLYTLLNHPEAFRSYVISSPSIMVNNGEILRAIPAFEAKITHGGLHPRVMLLVGSKETVSDDDLAKMPAAAAASYKAFPEVRSVTSLADRLGSISGMGSANVELQVFQGEDHMSVIPASLSRALTFAFRLPPR